MDVAQVALGASCLLAAATYADGKLQLSNDWYDLQRRKQGEKNFNEAVQHQGSPCFELFKTNATKWAHHEAIWTRKRSFTWAETKDMVCRYAMYFQSQGVEKGQFVALYLVNSPEFLFCWMALLSIGAAPAMINYNLSGEALVRCIEVSQAQLVIVDSQKDCRQRFESSSTALEQHGIKPVILDTATQKHVESLPVQDPHVDTPANPAIALMYTSGSTGLPKAMRVSMQRAYCTASVQKKTFGQLSGPYGDRTYHCMPLYHGTGGIAALIDLMGGLSVAIAPKFSVSSFWSDCIDSRSTIFMYVGEILRYLLAAKPSPVDKQHQVRLIWGNGLRADIWPQFQERFGIPEIGEFFATTEGMLTLVNHSRNELSVGAVGHHGWIERRNSQDAYISARVDALTGDLYRDPQTGLAEQTPLEIGGEILVRVPNLSAWQGYYGSKDATAKKFATDVLQKGDLFYRTGDALRRTADGYWYFLDRLGDTYRWKGENVSTTEVSQVLCNHPMVAEANVYGVSVPGHEGRAGSVAIRLKEHEANENWPASIAQHLRSQLPGYAVPVFIRVVPDSESMATGTYKHVKGPLQQEGVDLDKLGSKVTNGTNHQFFWLRQGSDQFVEYLPKDWKELQSGAIRL